MSSLDEFTRLSRDQLVDQIIVRYAATAYLGKGKFMKHKVYTVYDSKAECYMLPIYKRADGEAVRAFELSIADSSHQFGMNPADYTLFGIGEYDDDKARFVQYDAFVNLGNGAQFVPKVALPQGDK